MKKLALISALLLAAEHERVIFASSLLGPWLQALRRNRRSTSGSTAKPSAKSRSLTVWSPPSQLFI